MRRSPWAIGSSAAKAPNLAHVPSHTLRIPVLDRVKIQPPPASNVKFRTPSVPHITFGACRRSSRHAPARCPGGRGAGRAACAPASPAAPASAATRIPSKIRSRAWTFRWPSPWNGERSRSACRLQQRRVRHRGRRTPPRGLPLCRCCSRVCRAKRRARALPRLTHALDPVGAPQASESVALIAATSASLKGGAAPPPVPAHDSSFSRQLDVRVAASSASATRSPWRACKPCSRPATARSPVLQPVDLDAHFPDSAGDSPRSSRAPRPASGPPPALRRRQGPRLPCRAVGGHSGALGLPPIADAFTCTLLDRTISAHPLGHGISPNQCPRKLGAL